MPLCNRILFFVSPPDFDLHFTPLQGPGGICWRHSKTQHESEYSTTTDPYDVIFFPTTQKFIHVGTNAFLNQY